MKSVGSEAREVLVRAIVLLQNQPGFDGMLTRRRNGPIVSRFMHTYVGDIEKNVGKRAYREFKRDVGVFGSITSVWFRWC